MRRPVGKLAALVALAGGAGLLAYLGVQDPTRSGPLGFSLAAVQAGAAVAVLARVPGWRVASGLVLALQVVALVGSGLLFLLFTVLPVESMPFVGPAAAHSFNPVALLGLIVAVVVLVPLYATAFRWIGSQS